MSVAASTVAWQVNPLLEMPSSPSLLDAPKSTEACTFQSRLKSTSCGLAKIALFMDRTVYTAGSDITGRLEVSCKSANKVKFGSITVHVDGFEEILDRKAKGSHRRLFVQQSVTLQSVQLVPSEAVIPGTPDEHGCWQARQGRSIFDFTVKMPNEMTAGEANMKAPLPSSFWSRKYGGVRYIVSAFVQTKVKHGKPFELSAAREVQLLESNPATLCAFFPQTLPATSPFTQAKSVFIGSKSVLKKNPKATNLTMKVDLHVPEVGQNLGTLTGAWLSGGIGFVSVDISNQSKKNLSEVRLELIRKLNTYTPGENECLNPISSTRLAIVSKRYMATKVPRSSEQILDPRQASLGWAEDDYLGSNPTLLDSNLSMWDGVESGESRRMVVDMPIPKLVRSIRFGLLIDVSYAVRTTLFINGSDPMSVDMPVTILDPVTLYAALPPLSVQIKVPAATVNPISEPLYDFSSETPKHTAKGSLVSGSFKPRKRYGSPPHVATIFARDPTPEPVEPSPVSLSASSSQSPSRRPSVSQLPETFKDAIMHRSPSLVRSSVSTAVERQSVNTLPRSFGAHKGPGSPPPLPPKPLKRPSLNTAPPPSPLPSSDSFVKPKTTRAVSLSAQIAEAAERRKASVSTIVDVENKIDSLFSNVSA